MTTKFLSTKFLSILLLVFVAFTFAAEAGQVRPLESVKSLKIMAYNVKDLYLRRVNNPNGMAVEPKPVEQVRGVAKAILDVDPDIVILEEVDTVEVLRQFSNEFLGKGRYASALIEGNDTRGIDIGFLVKADLPLRLDMESHRTMTWHDPRKNMREPLFSRDLPVVFIRRDKSEKVPALIVVGNHGRSQRDRGTDIGGTQIRSAQYKAAAEIISDYMKRWPKVPVVLGGDFNTELRGNNPEVAPIRKIMADTFDVAKVPMDARTTHTFHPEGLPRVLSQLDGLFVSPSLIKSVRRVGVYRYRSSGGRELPLPRTYEERDKNPSDHFPIAIEISTEQIFPEAYGRQAVGF